MLDTIRAALGEALQACADTRVHHCELQATALDGDRCIISGVALDAAELAGVTDALRPRFPDLTFDTAPVRVLRGVGAATEWVLAANLTGLYASSSFLSEQLSQMLNGERLEVLLEEGRWCYVRQRDGYLGWVYGPYLAGPDRREVTHLVCEPVSLLRAEPAAAAPIVNRALAGTTVAVREEADGWVHLELAGAPEEPLRPALHGWVPASDVRRLAALPVDEPGRRAQIVADAARFMGVPYLWGGGSALGIDCSGYAQLLHKLVGVTLPRDADMQFDAGLPVEPPFRPADLLFFGEFGARRKITHVAVSLGGWRIIHSSRSRNGVQEDDVRAVDHLRESFVGARTFCP